MRILMRRMEEAWASYGPFLRRSSRDVWELYTLRSAVERLAAQLVAGSINSTKSSRLKWALDGLAKECTRGSPGRVAEADFALHKTIIQMSDHTRLASQYAELARKRARSRTQLPLWNSKRPAGSWGAP